MTQPQPGGAPDHTEVVVVGAGLAGLNAARELTAAGLAVTVVEGGADIGGRASTDRTDGFLLDRGFQLFNPAYPEARRVLSDEELALRPFARGVRVLRPGGEVVLADPRRRPGLLWGMRKVPGGLVAAARFAEYAAECGYRDAGSVKRRPALAMDEVLAESVRSKTLVEAVLRPFLAGVLGDWELATDRRYVDLVLRSFVRGTPSLPARGMSALAHQLAASAGSVHCGLPVVEVRPDRVVHAGGTIRAQAVIVATDGAAAARLVPGVPLPQFRALTTWYFAAPGDSFGGKGDLLVVDGTRRGILANVAAVSAVAPSYAPPGTTLVAATAVGQVGDDAAARAHLVELFGAVARSWRLLTRYEIPHALPAFSVGAPLRGRQDFGGIVVAGDHRDTPSIQGALASGRRAAQSVLVRLGRSG